MYENSETPLLMVLLSCLRSRFSYDLCALVEVCHLVYKVLIRFHVSLRVVAGPNKHDNLPVSSPSRKL